MKLLRLSARAGAIALAIGMAFPLAAQINAPMGGALPATDPAQTLSENLKALARDPYNVDALLQAGSGALAVGDPNAAFGFFARAEELSPSNARAKAGLGSALTMMERPREALRAFDEATALGMTEAGILEDRGLAFDLTGDARKAQKDYLAALKAGPSDELTRRFALSLGISGDKDAALARLEPLIRRNDQAAWRARAFVLAMNGDSPGAEKIVRMVAPAGTSASMLSFMQRLADLGPAARARAVHFGTLPANGTGLAQAMEADTFRPVDPTAAARMATPPPERASAVVTLPVNAKEARRKAREEDRLAKLAARGRQASERVQQAPTATGSPTPPAVAARVAAVMPTAGEKLVVVKGASSLPLPDAISMRAPSGQQIAVVTSKPSDPIMTTASSKTPPAPLFEVPAALPRPVTPALSPVLVSSAPSVATPAVGSTEVLASVDVKPLPTPVSAPASVPAPPPSQIQTNVASNPVIASPTPASPPPAAVTAVDLPRSDAPQQQLSVVVGTPVPALIAPSPSITPAAPTPEIAAPAPPNAVAPRPALSLADIVKTLELEEESAAAALPNEAQLRAARIAAQKKAAADAKLKAEKLAEEKRIAEEEAKARRNPARIWVQVATGNNEAGLPGTWRRLKTQASKSLSKQNAWTVPFRQTNRLLVGPIKSVGDARDLVSSLAKEGVQATTFSSDAGQEIFRIGGK
jgi:Flp pilus assembly protein TadD